MVIGIVALIVVGPKDLPGMFRTVGQFMGKARGMAREFQRSMEAAADESGLKEAADSMNKLDPLSQAQSSMKDYAKNYVSQKDKAASDAPSKGEALVKEAQNLASPAAKSVGTVAKDAAKTATDAAPAAEKAAAKKPAAKKPATKAPAKAATKKAPATKTAAKKPAAKAKPKAKPKATANKAEG